MQNGMVKNSISYKIIEGFPEVTIYQELEELYTLLFKDADLKFFNERLKSNQQQALFVVAYNESEPVGFKIGYPYDQDTFYSWIGGVLPQFRKQGIAMQLAILQEDYAKKRGFDKLRTKSMNAYKPMMILNLKNGFSIINVYTNTKGQTKIVFEKRIT